MAERSLRGLDTWALLPGLPSPTTSDPARSDCMFPRCLAPQTVSEREVAGNWKQGSANSQRDLSEAICRIGTGREGLGQTEAEVSKQSGQERVDSGGHGSSQPLKPPELSSRDL